MKSEASDAERVLRARARALAKAPESPPSSQSLLHVLEFRLAQETYALEIRYVLEVGPFRDLTPLPGTPPFLLGIVNVRGRIVPVFDLRKLFDLPEKGLTDLHRIILVRDAELELGLLADVALGVKHIPAESLQPSLPTLTGIRAEYLKGVTHERLVVLDLARILSDSRLIVSQDE